MEAASLRRLADSGSLEGLHDLGVTSLLLGELNTAVGSLELASLEAPANTVLLSDLSAALVERAESTHEPEDYALAYDAACRALELQPDRPEAIFNRAQALAGLGLRAFAIDGWASFLDAEQDPNWRSQALRWRDEAARGEARASALAEGEAAFRAALQSRDLAQAARRFHDDPRVALPAIGVDLLPAAAAVLLDGEGFRLQSLRELVSVVSKHWQEPQEAAAFEMMVSHPQELARAHIAFGRAVELIAGRRPEAALARLRPLESVLARYGGPYAPRVSMKIAAAQYLGGNVREALARVTKVIDCSKCAGQLLRAEAFQLRALILGTSLKGVHRQLGDYDEAELLLRFVGEGFSMSELASRQAGALTSLGETRRAWTYRARALSGVSGRAPAKQRYAHLTRTLADLQALKLTAAARDLAAKSEMAARQAGATEVADLARERIHLAPPEELAGAVLSARKALAAMPDVGIRERMEAEVAYAHALRSLDQKAPALPQAEFASRVLGQYGDRLNQARALVAAARSSLLMGDADGARASSARAFAALLGHKRRGRDRPGETGSLEWAGPALEELVDAYVATGDDASALDAFATLDDPTAATVAPLDRCVVLYFGREEMTDAWVLSGGRWTRVGLPVSRRERQRYSRSYAIATELNLRTARRRLLCRRTSRTAPF